MIGLNRLSYNGILVVTLILLVSFSSKSISNSVYAANSDAHTSSYPLWVIDDFGRNVTIDHYPKRIVSLAPSATEILFAVGAGDRIVGVTEYCDYPPEVLKLVNDGSIELVGGYKNPNIEVVIFLNPDLIVAATTLQSEIILNLEKKGFQIVGLNPQNIGQILSDIELIGLVSGQVEIAERLIYTLEKRMTYIFSRLGNADREVRVYYELWFDPLMTVGPGTWIDEIISRGGGINIFHDAGSRYPTINSESVIERNPELIIIPLQYMGTTSIEEFEKRPGWSTIEAVRNKRIHEIEEDLVLRPAPRIINGLEQVALLIHPELYTGIIMADQETLLSTNSWITSYVYDETRRLINFTVTGTEEYYGHFNITFKKTAIEGSPIVLLDGVETTFDLLQNETYYHLYIEYPHSIHSVTIGGTSTIPEFNTILIPFAVALALTLLYAKKLKLRKLS